MEERDTKRNTDLNFFKRKEQGKKKKAKPIHNGAIGKFVTKTIAERREKTLFDTAEQIGRDKELESYSKEGINFIDERYSNSATRTLYGLAYVISFDNDKEEVKAYREKALFDKELGRAIQGRIELKQFSDLLFGEHRKRFISMIIRDIMQLQAIPIAWNYTIQGELWTDIGAIIKAHISYKRDELDKAVKEQYGGELSPREVAVAMRKFAFGDTRIYPLTDKEQFIVNGVVEAISKKGYIDIDFERPFFQGKYFSYIPQKLLTEWGKGGATQNDVFPVLLSELLTISGNYRYWAGKARGAARKEAKEAKKTTEETKALIEYREKAVLEGELLLRTIDQAATNGYFFKKRNYARLEKYVKDTMIFCKDTIALITDYHFEGKGQSEKVVFSFNPQYGKPPKEDIPGEATTAHTPQLS
jgi:hypothetical protein